MIPEQQEVKVIVLKFATVLTCEVVAVMKLNQPATLHTNEVPYIQLLIRNTQPLLIPYETEEERDLDYDKICQEISTASCY